MPEKTPENKIMTYKDPKLSHSVRPKEYTISI